MKRRPTIIDVAAKAGVSKTTVSRVVSGDGARVRDETRSRVLEAIEELGYTHNAVASSLRTDRTHIIMLAIPDITNPFWPAVARGVQDEMEVGGYSVVFANSDWDDQREKMFLKMARRNRFDAILINPVRVSNDELKATGLATVVLGSHEDYPDFDIVGTDSHSGTYQALEHLYELGHRRIGLIRGRRQSRPGHSRLLGYKDFHRTHGLVYDPSLVIQVPFDEEGGREALRRLINSSEPPTAVVAANDILAIGVLQEVHEVGLRIPEQLSIVGMDDIRAASATTPPLTTVAKPKYEMGRQAARFLLDRLHNRPDFGPRRHLFSGKLQRRGSTGPPDK
ncbi:MAG: LacI family DNA-binding transcriptional regulator [Candidatus Promineifilaceae bacterium]|nr:LacI family DNA-binding transcriptional regulator [Candidatus Promineifilaceae bacterium]